ncbi:hypothetical protein [Dietzia sp. CH92]|uniref:hypothetical protein n=1 Tax=Dietzia sp. CH92 TaxID=3051823 RepID=UPI0028D8AF8F|nr:hypothetical protein [Dietzia sp. CH92]
MDPRQTPDPATGEHDDTGRPAEHDDAGRPEGSGDPGRSGSADVLTMGLFGAMVIIASICFVIW